jgi:hypothetical protein
LRKPHLQEFWSAYFLGVVFQFQLLDIRRKWNWRPKGEWIYEFIELYFKKPSKGTNWPCLIPELQCN